MKSCTKGTRLSPLLIGVYAACLARVGEKKLECSYWRGANERERERERVANYLELPNNLMTFFAKKYSRYES